MSPTQDLNYFTCTLGIASELRQRDPSRRIDATTIAAFLRDQANDKADAPAIGFADPGNETSKPQTILYSFRDLELASSQVASQLKGSLVGHADTVALLCRSTPDFLFTWLALIRLGFSVLLIAPQNAPPAIAHLCHTCKVRQIIYDEAYKDLSRQAAQTMESEKGQKLDTISIPFNSQDEAFVEKFRRYHIGPAETKHSANSIAFYFHTSGTSSGLPKPIPQSHNGALLCLARIPESASKATFSTTPLYHGGVADCFRAWSSDALIWLFWNRDRPITAPNVCKCLQAADESPGQLPPVKFFSSVPYILQMMASGDEGLQRLQNMDLVGVGGAALPAEVGDDLVKKNVNLVSRYGSAECGFLLSSHRNYKADKEWQYLRNDGGAGSLSFEARDDNLSEIVVPPSWPHRAKTNREDGSFATSDLFAPHTSIPNAWRYHSRADAQLTLITGKKFDPSPLENSIATSHLLDDVFIFGDDKPFPGALLFRSQEAADMQDEDLIHALSDSIEKLNQQSANHARLARNMLIPMPAHSNKLQKSSKGTLLRNKAVEAYKQEIENAYTRVDADLQKQISDEDILAFLAGRIQSILGTTRKPDPDADLFGFGVDSVASIQLRHLVKRLIAQSAPPSGHVPEPSLTVVEECGTPSRLAEYILSVRRGDNPVRNRDDDFNLMQKLVDKHSSFTPPIDFSSLPARDRQDDGRTILLTGSTGSLGAHILHLLRSSPRISHIYLLVRGATPTAAHDRVSKALTSRNLPDLTSTSAAKVTILQARLSDPFLGLDETMYKNVAGSVTHIVHAAWTVNFRLRLPSFTEHLAGTENLLSLAIHAPRTVTFFFASSVASVASFRTSTASSSPSTPGLDPASTSDSPSASASEAKSISVPEEISLNPAHASPLGYAQSKWTAESICTRASSFLSANSTASPASASVETRNEGTSTKDKNETQSTDKNEEQKRIVIARIGQLTGDTRHGIWNASEAWPIMFSAGSRIHALPLLDVKLDWLPVDVAAAGVLELLFLASDNVGCAVSGHAAARLKGEEKGKGKAEVEVYHILNDAKPATSWRTMLDWLSHPQSQSQSYSAEGKTISIPPEEFLARIEKEEKGDAKKLIGLWRDAYTSSGKTAAKTDSKGDTDAEMKMERERVFDASKARRASTVLRDNVRCLDRELFEKLWRWCAECV